MIIMKRSTVGLIPVAAAMILSVAGTLYAQQHTGGASTATAATTSDVPEVFCNHMGTGQLCPGNARMFDLSGAKKEQYLEALNKYNKAVETASKEFLIDAKDKVGLSAVELAVAEKWFAVGLNPAINEIIAVKGKQ
jgi:hypothetical protein